MNPSSTLPSAGHDSQLLVFPVAILEQKMVKRHNQVVAKVLVQWSSTTPEDATWEDAMIIRARSPHLRQYPLAPCPSLPPGLASLLLSQVLPSFILPSFLLLSGTRITFGRPIAARCIISRNRVRDKHNNLGLNLLSSCQNVLPMPIMDLAQVEISRVLLSGIKGG
ncbi:hypothetical protein LWI28_000778 [Acer negundo]|uniref:Chromo domain-containing protein n=1 Tax=Acer negundo TaxID=4023 RepID=A0AAD5IC85_ACENE|nr:hypothetical protein LWI28_000778 [Acer negundo]